MRIKISRKAYDDLEAIYKYTHHKWGAKQAESYRTALDDQFKLLADYPEIGIKLLAAPHYRQLSLENHVIIYRVTSDAIFIVRVRHGAENPDTPVNIDPHQSGFGGRG